MWRRHEQSRVPDEMPAFLPDEWKGGVALLAIVFVLCCDQSGRTSAPISPQAVQTMRRPRGRRTVSSGKQSASSVAL
jgi:hypothetical protein